MDTTITVTPDVTTLINILTVEPENQTKLAELLRDNTDNVVCTLDGCISAAQRCWCTTARSPSRRLPILLPWVSMEAALNKSGNFQFNRFGRLKPEIMA